MKAVPTETALKYSGTGLDRLNSIGDSNHFANTLAGRQVTGSADACIPPDSSWMMLDDAGQMIGKCSLWWRAVPHHPEHRLGFIGHFHAEDAANAADILRRACRELTEAGCTLGVGPIDGSTWHAYRFVVDWGSEPNFFMEPQHPRSWPRYFQENGFSSWLDYFSAVETNLDRQDPFDHELAGYMRCIGVRVRALEMERFEAELAGIHGLASNSFRQHDLYREIDLDNFLRLYGPLRPHLFPEFVHIAERAGQPVGFVFAVPDLLQADRGQRVDTLIVKSMAVLPDRMLAGLSYHLLSGLRRQALNNGFHRFIYALVRDSGYLQRRIMQFATPIRRYAVFAKELDA